jgi:hypothetical protein
LQANQPDLVRGFVRGDIDWLSLEALGVKVDLDEDVARLEAPAGIPGFVPSLGDVAAGVLKAASSHAPAPDGRDWARVLLNANFIDLVALEGSIDGEQLLEAIWTLAAGEQLDEAAIDVARRHAAGTA